MSKPVNEIQLSTEQLNTALQTYLNEHVFRELITVVGVEIESGSYSSKPAVKVRLGVVIEETA